MAIYLKIDGIEGECEKKGHEKWIECASWSWSASNSASVKASTGFSSSTVNFSDLQLACETSKVSLLLLHYTTLGKHLGEVTLDITKATGAKEEEVWFQVKSKSAMLNSYSTGGQAGDYEQTMMDSFSIALADYTQEIWAQVTKDGALKTAGTHGFNMEKKEAT